jgi:hypothetical protein
MTRSKEIKIAGKQHTIRELTIKEIINLKATPKGIEIADGFFNLDHEYCIGMLSHCSGMTVDEILKLGVREYKTALEALVEVNADFFELWGPEMEKRKTGSPSPKSSAG